MTVILKSKIKTGMHPYWWGLLRSRSIPTTSEIEQVKTRFKFAKLVYQHLALDVLRLELILILAYTNQ
ncbi:hypothetical protein [Nostoc sp. CHAB 5715]|uniref:hypothetical protein n=1 Tax=Nostoc sp. CHAB 5715 TaxID=2780400 RepID=UPI001E4903B7|nr:hypothetical protein [Nostoc sp. CHAB 5715]MCC5621303.1 hypothetical protein [Nostoc sp. CHAB 5715]